MGCLKASYALSSHLPETGNSLGSGLQINGPLPCPWIPSPHSLSLTFTHLHTHIYNPTLTQEACTQPGSVHVPVPVLPFSAAVSCFTTVHHNLHIAHYPKGTSSCPYCCHLIMPEPDSHTRVTCMTDMLCSTSLAGHTNTQSS